MIGEIRAQEGEREVREVDLPEQPPSEAQAKAEQTVQRADEHAREDGLPEERGAGQVHPSGGRKSAAGPIRAVAREHACQGTISLAPGAATDFGHTTTQRPFCTCFTRIRSSP